MELVGVADIVSVYHVQMAALLRYDVYASVSKADQSMRAAGVNLSRTLSELLSKVDVVVVCTPKKVAASNKLAYEAAGVKSEFRGGEGHSLSGHSFVAQTNYASAIGPRKHPRGFL